MGLRIIKTPTSRSSCPNPVGNSYTLHLTALEEELLLAKGGDITASLYGLVQDYTVETLEMISQHLMEDES